MTFCVGPWLVQPSLNTLSRNGTTVQIEPKVMSVLVCLAEHPGETVAKEQLLQTVWPDTFVGEGVLTRSIFELRRAFEDEAKEPKVIQTIPKRGYRLLAPVTPVNVPPSNAPVPQLDFKGTGGSQSRPKWISGLAAAGGIVLLVAFLVAANVGHLREGVWRPTGVPQIHSLAVLPLKNLSGDPAQDYFAAGMTDELITYLSQISSIRVISYTSTYRYKDTQKGLPEIARELGVDGVVEGSVQRVGDRVRVNAQLVYAPQDSHLWAQSYERNLLDALAVQSTIAGTIADQIKLKLTPSQQARLRPARPVNLDALSAYLKGVDHYGRVGHGFGGEEIKKAVEFFEQAITEDPGFASPYVKLAQIYGEDPLPYLKESLPSQRSLIEKALSLDPNSSEIHTALGCLRFSKDWDWAGAESEFKRALELNSNDALAHLSLGEYWESMGRMEEGMRERERAQELDPANDYVSPGFFRARDYDREIAFLTKRLEVMPGDGGVHTQLSTCYAYKGMEKDAVAQLQQALVLFGFEDAAHHMVRAFTAKGYRGALYVLTRDMEGAYERGQFDRPDLLAEIYTRLGEKDKAFAWLQKAYEERSGAMVFLNAEPFWDPLRSDPRFKDLVRRVGLPDCCGKIAIALH